MDDKIYILKNRTRIKGPYTLEVLPQKIQSPNDLVWYKGLTDWTKVSLIDSFKDLVKTNQSTKIKPPFWKQLI